MSEIKTWKELIQEMYPDGVLDEDMVTAPVIAMKTEIRNLRAALADRDARIAEMEKHLSVLDGTITTEMKIACMNEFSWTEECPYYDEDGNLHDNHVETHAVPWSLCKEIYRAMLKSARDGS